MALVVLWLATGNIIVALLATVNMVCVTVCILGFMYVLGWELGTIESVSATVLVGLSVDYVVHLAQAYVEADAVSREARVRSALLEMGSTVFGGAITSLGASAFLFGCVKSHLCLSPSAVFATHSCVEPVCWIPGAGYNTFSSLADSCF